MVIILVVSKLYTGIQVATVRRPRTPISIGLLLVVCEGFWAEPCFFEDARKSDPPKARAVTPYIYLKPTNNKSVPILDVFTIKYYMNGHSWHLCLFWFFPSRRVFMLAGEFTVIQ